MNVLLRSALIACCALLQAGLLLAADWPVLLTEDFEKGADRWKPTDAAAWKIEEVAGGHAFSQFVKQSKYEPPHRSPYNIALLKDVIVGAGCPATKTGVWAVTLPNGFVAVRVNVVGAVT